VRVNGGGEIGGGGGGGGRWRRKCGGGSEGAGEEGERGRERIGSFGCITVLPALF